MKLFIIANRLPVKAHKNSEGRYEFFRSEGGLATGLASLDLDIEMHWIGWPGIFINDEHEKEEVRYQLEMMDFHPVFLSESQIKNYYEGYSNSTVWPLCHYFYTFVEYENLFWETYKEVNLLFCRKTAEIANPGDVVWIHDYQLMLAPRMLREISEGLSIGYFLHIPFPSYELFRILPERAELLNGLLGADLIAFHTHDYMRHFISAVERVMGLHFELDKVLFGNRVVQVDSIPMGINFELYNNAILNPEIKNKAEQFRKEYGNHKLILSVDRLDYSKGIMHRLKGFAKFLTDNPQYHENVSLVMVVVPSRSNVNRYAKLKKNIDEAIGAINGKYSTINWTPIYYFYYGFQFNELVALYYIADIALVSPLRDGMNLVAKEYVAAKRDNPGVLILSEMAGASAQLSEALTINPNDINQISEALHTAMEMPVEQQLVSMKRMRDSVSFHTVNRWAELFINQLLAIRKKNLENDMKRMTGENLEKICNAYKKAKNRLLILDYDGTLSPFKNKPGDAIPTTPLLDLLGKLMNDPKNKIVISSGRDHNTLENWFGTLNIDMAAEHGAFYKENGQWVRTGEPVLWDPGILRILETFVNKTPNSVLEIKETALVWHYRRVDAWLASLREQQLINLLIEPCSRMNLQIMRGNKIVEIKPPVFSKGSEARRLIKQDRYDFILAIGDDVTDEDTFRALPKRSYTIKIGNVSDNARYYMITQSETLPFLSLLAECSWPDKTRK